MGQTKAAILSLIIVFSLALTAPNSLAEGEGNTIIEGSTDKPGPAWLEFECLQVSCTGLELVIQVDGLDYVSSDTHSVQWSGLIGSNLSWEVNVGDGFDIGDVGFDYILPGDSSLVEPGDLPDTVPVPNHRLRRDGLGAGSLAGRPVFELRGFRIRRRTGVQADTTHCTP